MSQAKNKVIWCLRKAENELKTSKKHRGLVKTKEDKQKAKEHIRKAEHNLKLMIHLKKNNFSLVRPCCILFRLSLPACDNLKIRL